MRNYIIAGGALLVLLLTPRGATGEDPCVGDCNHDGTVSINELINAVSVALGSADVNECTDADADDNGNVGINELVTAVSRALNGCHYGPMSLSTGELCFAAPVAAPVPGQGVRVRFAKGPWTARTTAPWVTVAPGNGQAPADLDVTVYTAGLSDGAYTAEIQFADAGGDAVSVRVALNLYAPGRTEGWQVQTVEPVGTVDQRTSLALDPQGRPGITFFRDDQAVVRQLRYARWSGCTWAVESLEKDGRHSSLAFDRGGQPHISFFSEKLLALRYARRIGDFWNVVTVDQEGPGGSTGHRTSLALDTADLPHISYLLKFVEGQIFTYDLRYARFDGSSWMLQTVDTEDTTGWDSSLALNSAGQARITYWNNTTNMLKYAEWPGNCWNIQTVGHGGRPSSLRLDSAERPVVAYHDSAGDGVVKFAHREAGTWQVETLDRQGLPPQGGDRAYVSLALDSVGTPHIAYVDFFAGTLKYASRNDSGDWLVQVVDEGGNVGNFCSLQIDDHDVAHISYLDQDRGILKYAQGPATP